MSKHVVIVFGEMGAGKNYHGKRIAHERGLAFLDGDDVLPPEMLAKVRRFGFLPRKTIEDYVHGPLLDAIEWYATQGSGVVVAQALYSDELRKSLAAKLELKGFTVDFVRVTAPLWRNMRQIASRPRGMRWVLYWLLSKPFFETPSHTCETLTR